MKNIKWLILSLIGVANIHGDSWIFKSEEEAKEVFRDSKIVCREIVDPSYDQTFKMVMSTDPDKQKYLMSFLNSIYFPRAKGEEVMIRRIEALDKENEKMKEPQKKKTKKSEKSSNNITLCDVACKCIYYADHSSEDSGDRRKRSSDEIKEAFDLEMQRSKQANFTIRLMNYGQNLRTRNKVCVKALGLLNFPKEKVLQDESACYAWCRINPMTNQPERLTEKENILETNTIDLRKLADGKEIYINGKKLDIVGITWLKLFGVKQWCKPSDNGVKYKIYYPEDKIDKNIKDVIEIILSCINQEDYEDMLRVIENAEDSLNTAKNEGINIGKAEGIEIGKAEGIKQTIKKMYSKGMGEEQIANVLELPLEEVQKMLSE